MELFWLRSRIAWEIHVVFVMRLAASRPPRVQRIIRETKEDGERPDPARRCEITPGSHVFQFILFTLRFWDDGADCTPRCWRPPRCSRCSLSSFFFFFFPKPSCGNDASPNRQKSLRTITARICCGTGHACGLLLWIWKVLRGNILCWSWGENLSRYYWQLLLGEPSDSSGFSRSGTCCACCKIIIVHSITSAGWRNTRGAELTVDSPAAPSRSNECHYAPNQLKFLVIREAQWGSPEQLCCPGTDKKLPLLKGPTPHLDKRHNKQNTFVTIPSLMCEAGPSCLHPESIWRRSMFCWTFEELKPHCSIGKGFRKMSVTSNYFGVDMNNIKQEFCKWKGKNKKPGFAFVQMFHVQIAKKRTSCRITFFE